MVVSDNIMIVTVFALHGTNFRDFPFLSVIIVDEKKLGGALKKLGLQSIPGIEEVNLFKEDGDVIHFGSPKVQANVQSHIFVVSGQADCKPIQSYLPGILSQLGPEGLAQLRKVAAQYENGGAAAEDDDDEDIPDLVENFEEASEK